MCVKQQQREYREEKHSNEIKIKMEDNNKENKDLHSTLDSCKKARNHLIIIFHHQIIISLCGRTITAFIVNTRSFTFGTIYCCFIFDSFFSLPLSPSLSSQTVFELFVLISLRNMRNKIYCKLWSPHDQCWSGLFATNKM